MRAFARTGSAVRLGLAGAVAVILLLATACQTRFNLAASVGSTRIDIPQLQAFTHRSEAAMATAGQPVGTDPAKQAQFQRSVLSFLVRESLLTQVAAKQGVTATPSDVAGLRSQLVAQAGSEQAFIQQLEGGGFSPQDVDVVLRENVLLSKLKVADTAALSKLLSEGSRTIKVRVNPRFGAWDAQAADIADSTDLASNVTRS